MHKGSVQSLLREKTWIPLTGHLFCTFCQEQVGKMKKSYDHQLFLKSLPLGFKQFLEHISNLKYEDKPDYKVKCNKLLFRSLSFSSS